jgi:hypothetical protein
MTEEQSPQNEPPVPAEIPRDKGLTIPARRLAGSPACLNCGTELQGPFCHYCGQPDKNFMRFFPVLVRDLITDFLDLDSRFFRTLKPLLFQPGKLTRDYLDGQRFRYTPPLRLYIFSSMAFFILAAMLAGDAISITNDDNNTDMDVAVGIIRSGGDEEELARAREALDRVQPGLGDKVAEAVEETERKKAAERAAETTDGTPPKDPESKESPEFEAGIRIDEDEININGKPWDRETNPFIIPWMPDWVNDRVNDEIGESPKKGKEIEANPNLIIDKVFDVLPATMFVLLPLSALILKFWYLFAGRYYIEHLILALHNHSFLFVVFLFTMLFNTYAGWREPGEQGWITETVFWVNLALYIWIPVYFLLSLKRVYRQGWFLTGVKYVVVGLSYLILLTITASVAAILSFVLV